jgi:hypothetical protein
MKEEIKIVYKYNVPDELITEFVQLGVSKAFETNVEKGINEDRYYSFIGTELSEIIVYVTQNANGLEVGLLGNAVYDLLKRGVGVLWAGLAKLKEKKTQGNEISQSKSISLRFINHDKAVEIVFAGDYNENQAEKIIEDSFNFIRENADTALRNPDYLVPKSEKPSIRLVFNEDNQVWEPENFGEKARTMEDFQKWAEQNFDN